MFEVTYMPIPGFTELREKWLLENKLFDFLPLIYQHLRFPFRRFCKACPSRRWYQQRPWSAGCPWREWWPAYGYGGSLVPRAQWVTNCTEMTVSIFIPTVCLPSSNPTKVSPSHTEINKKIFRNNCYER